MAAHDSMIAARVKQTCAANRKNLPAPFEEGDLVYLSTKKIKFEKGLARKLIPKFIGPYRVLKDFGNSSFQIELPSNLKQRGVHAVFHAALLRVHVPNDDQQFPGRLENQLGITAEYKDDEWSATKITSHHGKHTSAIFEVLWATGDRTWMPYGQAVRLGCFQDYLDALGVPDIKELPHGAGTPLMTPKYLLERSTWCSWDLCVIKTRTVVRIYTPLAPPL
jgi:hypothetical protein